MAICRFCDAEVAPIDKVLRFDGADPVFFCSEDHAREWEKGRTAPKKTPEPTPEPEIGPDSPLAERETPPPAPRRGPGRPKGSKNRS